MLNIIAYVVHLRLFFKFHSLLSVWNINWLYYIYLINWASHWEQGTTTHFVVLVLKPNISIHNLRFTSCNMCNVSYNLPLLIILLVKISSEISCRLINIKANMVSFILHQWSFGQEIKYVFLQCLLMKIKGLHPLKIYASGHQYLVG